MNFIKNDSYYCRYYDEFLILLETGMRVSELIALNLHDVNLDVGYIITGQNTKKERFVPLYQLAIKAISDYIEFSRPSFFKEETP